MSTIPHEADQGIEKRVFTGEVDRIPFGKNFGNLEITFPFSTSVSLRLSPFNMTASDTISPDEARASFAASLSEMYRKEIPQYGTLLELVSKINGKVNEERPSYQDPLKRVEVERHGAIRVGTPEELAMMRRLFRLMGMEPVGYYDLTVAGLPVHATGFRPLTEASLLYNPFRVFTSLLRLDLIKDEGLRKHVKKIIDDRTIFTPRCVDLIEQLEKSPNYPRRAIYELIEEALDTFRWHETSTVDIGTYKELEANHPLIADIVCFRGPHINHLTPRVLDIDAAHSAMESHGLNAKTSIEGPPPRQNEILLRQTSFLALEENVAFKGGSQCGGKHRARFGEIEQRGIALTPKGRQMYDEHLKRFTRTCAQLPSHATAGWKSALLKTCFESFPDDLETLRLEKLAYFRYYVVEGFEKPSAITDIDSLVQTGCVRFTPITYEDFLPASAAGIFHSNLSAGGEQIESELADKEGFERALGCSINDEFDIYSKIEHSSIAACLDYQSQVSGCGKQYLD